MKSLLLVVVFGTALPISALGQSIDQKEAQESLKGLKAPIEGSGGKAAVSLPHQGSQKDVLAELAEEVEKLQSQVDVTSSNVRATQKPQSAKSIGSKKYYNFSEGAIYEIHTGVDRVSDIALQPGEKLTNQPVSGDTVRWTVGTIESMTKGTSQVHLIIKPLEEQLETNVIVTTNRRVYHLRVTSGDWYMPSVAWHYPDEELAAKRTQIERQEEQEPLALSPEKLSFDYEIVTDDQRWAPILCFDDGQKTYLRMPRQMDESPALFLRAEDGEPLLVNYRVKGDYYILDRLFDRAELRVGRREPVVIYSSRKPRSFWERLF